MILKRIFGRPDRDDMPLAIYRELVAQARRPGFYLHAGVPDTLEGRFEMVVLHAYLVLRRFRALGESGRELGQRLFDVLFDDMDQTLREIGVGDLSVGKKIRAMASAFYGRVAAYDEGLASSDASVLADAIRRNVFADEEPAAAHVEALAAYIRRADVALATQSDNAMMAGEILFAPAPAPASTGEKP